MLIFSDGSKGGTGKSLVAALLLDHYLTASAGPVLIETDTSNPDVYKAYNNSLKALTCNIDTEDGWALFLNYLDEHRDLPVVVNCGARNQEAIATWGETISVIGLAHKTLWVINHEKDSLLLLNQYCKTVPAETVIVVKNGFYGKEDDFSEFNNSKIRKIVSSELYLPKLMKKAASALYSYRKPLHEAGGFLPVGERIMFESWYRKAQALIREILA